MIIRWKEITILTALLLVLAAIQISCDSGDDDDDTTSDDDAADDDAADDDTVDDDTADDDDEDDDTIDDDIPDDDSETDDDAADDDTDPGSTWTDPTSGLTWQVNPSFMNWEKAKTYCNNLTLTRSDWHLPTISELRTLIRGCDGSMAGGSCNVTDDCLSTGDCWSEQSCGGCNILEGPGSGGAYWPDGISGDISWYWSSSPMADVDYTAWVVDFEDARIQGTPDKPAFNLHTRCVH